MSRAKIFPSYTKMNRTIDHYPAASMFAIPMWFKPQIDS